METENRVSTRRVQRSGSKFNFNTGGGFAAIVLWSTSFAIARSLSEHVGPLTAGASAYLIGGGFCLLEAACCLSPVPCSVGFPFPTGLKFIEDNQPPLGCSGRIQCCNGPTLEGFNNYGYSALARKYSVKLMDLDEDDVERVHVFDEKDFRPHPVRMSKLLLDRNSFIISAATMKTHDRIVATLSLKNIILGAPIKDPGFRWGKGAKSGAKNDKPIVHGNSFRALNYNLFDLARRLHPHLAVIDGYDGMEGNGPVGGTLVEHRVCVVSPDWLAADRVAVELMGIDYAKVGYLNYCAEAGLGEGNLQKIEIVGEPIARHARRYQLADNIDKQLDWMMPPKPI